MRCVRLRRTALRANPRINASTQPPEGAGKSKAAEAAYRPAWLFGPCTFENCGSGLAREGGLPADHSLTDVPDQIVGASLLAKAACQPTNLSQMYPIKL
ncbi:hypothetical protein D3C85_1345570 [compost metagenome]